MSLEIAVVFVLILFNGFFALSEMSVVTARKTKLKQQALTSKRARVALELSEQPERFLSSIQVWITLISILTTFFGGDAIAGVMQQKLLQYPLIAPYAEGTSVAISVGLILVFSVVLGELVPKRLAILRPEKVAIAVAIPMRFLSAVAKPVVIGLAWMTETLLKLFPKPSDSDSDVTEEEIKLLVAESHEQGVIDRDERNMVNRVLNLGDRTVDSLMTPRPRMVWLDVAASLADNLSVLHEHPYSRYPVFRGSDQDVVGVVQTKDLLAEMTSGKKPDLFKVVTPPLFVPESAKATALLEQFRDAEVAFAFVVDEYGEIKGMITLNDVITAVFGRLTHAMEAGEHPIVQRADGSWLIDGALSIEDLREHLGLVDLPNQDEEYRTVAGMIMAHFARIPSVGESFDHAAFRFEVIDLDGARIDKVLVSALAPREVG